MLKRHHELRVPAEETFSDVVHGFVRQMKSAPRASIPITRIDEHTVRSGKTMRIPAIRSRPERIHNGKRSAFFG